MILNKIFSYVLNKFEKRMKSKSISYVLFDYFYLKKICKDINNNFFRLGYEKINSNFSGFVEKINNHISNLKLTKNTEYLKLYEIDEYVENQVYDLCNNQLKKTLEDLSKIYKSNIFLANIKIAQNYNFEENTQKYSNFYHVDNNRCTLFKIFISLEDVSSNQGPTNIIPNNKKNEFLKETKYKNRYDYDHTTDNFEIFKNTNLKGDALICNTSRCYHKAGVPDKNVSRKMMTLSFVAYPKEYEKFNYLDFIKNQKLSLIYEKNFINYLSKSKNFYDNYRIYKNYVRFMKKKYNY